MNIPNRMRHLINYAIGLSLQKSERKQLYMICSPEQFYIVCRMLETGSFLWPSWAGLSIRQGTLQRMHVYKQLLLSLFCRIAHTEGLVKVSSSNIKGKQSWRSRSPRSWRTFYVMVRYLESNLVTDRQQIEWLKNEYNMHALSSSW